MKMYIMIVCVYVRVFARRKLNFMRSWGVWGGGAPPVPSRSIPPGGSPKGCYVGCQKVEKI